MTFPSLKDPMMKGGLAVAAAAVALGAGMSISKAYSEKREAAALEAATSMVAPASEALFTRIEEGQMAFATGIADAHDDMRGISRGGWTQIDYGAGSTGLQDIYQAGYDWQAEHRLDTSAVEVTLTMSANWTQMARDTIGTLSNSYAAMDISQPAIDATIINGVFDAAHHHLQVSPAFDAALDRLAATGDTGKDKALDELRDAVSGIYGKIFHGEEQLLAKLSADALIITEVNSAPRPDPFAPPPEDEMRMAFNSGPDSPASW